MAIPFVFCWSKKDPAKRDQNQFKKLQQSVIDTFKNRLFVPNTSRRLCNAVLNEEPEPVSKLRKDVPMELEAVLHEALGKDLEERYQHAEEMLADLHKLKKEIDSGSSHFRM